MKDLEAAHSAILDWLAASEADMVELLAQLVNIDSPSLDPAGIEQVAECLRSFLELHGVEARCAAVSSAPPVVEAEVPGGVEHAPVLLMGHMDTVFPRGTAAKRPFAETGDRLYGPGVADMKGGLVLQCFLLAAFARHAPGLVPLAGLFTPDEEIASPGSRPRIVAAARSAGMALNAEPGRANGNFVRERKGGLFLTLKVKGKAAHSGVDFGAGASAITSLAQMILKLDAINGKEPGVTVNTGLVSGGVSINTVAPMAEASVDIRYRHPEQRGALLERVLALSAQPDVEGTSAQAEILGEFDPLIPSPGSTRLQDLYKAASMRLGFPVDGEATGGCSDAGFAASAGIPVICGVGPVGGRAHTDEEYIEWASLVPRAQTAAWTILESMRLGHLRRTAGSNPATYDQQ